MPKKTIQDIYVIKKSIRMIKKSDIRDGFYINKKKIPIDRNFSNDLVNKFPIENNTENTNNGESGEEKKHVTKDSLMFLWIICIISITTLLFLVSSMFATTTLTITPKSENIILNDTYYITSDKNISSSSLHYEVMTIKKDLSEVLETDGEEYVERKATGKAILYNNFNTSNQKLIINTRLETKDGLIYKTRQSVVVPGIKTVSGVKTPGSVEVEIIADDVGDKYNMKLSDFKGDFTIFGFKGTPKYSKFYARQSTDIIGGLVGNIKKVSDDKIEAGRIELKNTLKDDLIKEVFSKKPEQFILFKDNYYIQCNDLATDLLSKEYKISEECSINAIIFHKDILATFIATNKINNFNNSKVDIMWNDNNSVSLQGITEKPWNETSLKAKFKGSIQVVWFFDASEILASILGQNKSVISLVIENNKNSLKEIQTTIRPMWRNTFPTNVKKIKIIDTIRGGIM
ncbi:MAG: hypothetical protein ABIF22_02675 [bacterium]